MTCALFQVGKKSTLTRVECECNHFSSFASKVFVAPNPIDISAVLAGFSNIADNLSVLMLECGLVGLYIILVIICRKFDKKDQRKVSCASFLRR